MKKTLKTKNGVVSYSSYGTGSPIVFLHGFLGNSEIWDSFVSHFKKKHMVVAIDLPGHGETTDLTEEISMTYAAKLVKQVLETENINAIHLIGHSMGGYVGLAFAKMFDFV